MTDKSTNRLSRQKSVMNIEANPLDSGILREGSVIKIENLNDAILITPEKMNDLLALLNSVEENDKRIAMLEVEKVPYLFSSENLAKIVDITPSVKTKLNFIGQIGSRLIDPRAKSDYFIGLFRYSEEKAIVEEILKARVQTISSSLFKATNNQTDKSRNRSIGGRGGRGGRGERRETFTAASMARGVSHDNLPEFQRFSLRMEEDASGVKARSSDKVNEISKVTDPTIATAIQNVEQRKSVKFSPGSVHVTPDHSIPPDSPQYITSADKRIITNLGDIFGEIDKIVAGESIPTSSLDPIYESSTDDAETKKSSTSYLEYSSSSADNNKIGVIGKDYSNRPLPKTDIQSIKSSTSSVTSIPFKKVSYDAQEQELKLGSTSNSTDMDSSATTPESIGSINSSQNKKSFTKVDGLIPTKETSDRKVTIQVDTQHGSENGTRRGSKGNNRATISGNLVSHPNGQTKPTPYLTPAPVSTDKPLQLADIGNEETKQNFLKSKNAFLNKNPVNGSNGVTHSQPAPLAVSRRYHSAAETQRSQINHSVIPIVSKTVFEENEPSPAIQPSTGRVPLKKTGSDNTDFRSSFDRERTMSNDDFDIACDLNEPPASATSSAPTSPHVPGLGMSRRSSLRRQSEFWIVNRIHGTGETILPRAFSLASDTAGLCAGVLKMDKLAFLSLLPEGPVKEVNETPEGSGEKDDVTKPAKIEEYFRYRELVRRNYTKEYKGLTQSELEKYLTEKEFLEVFGKKKSDFYSMPRWKQIDHKKKSMLF